MDLVLLIGQSNAKGCGNPEQSEVAEHGFEYMENFTGQACIPLGRTLQLSEGRGTIAPAFANQYWADMQEEVCFVHYAVDGSRIKNWMHDNNRFLDAAIEKFQHAEAYISKNVKVGRKLAVWIQGESDAKYGTHPLYYKEQLKSIAKALYERCEIAETFVSRTGYWLPHSAYQKRCERIGAVQELVCQEEEHLVLISKMAVSFVERDLLQDEVHYCMEALNQLGCEIAQNIGIYYNDVKKLSFAEERQFDKAREYIHRLEMLEVEA